MIILTNCLSQIVDEGCLKVANSLVRRIRKKVPDTTVVTYEKESELSDLHVSPNKFMFDLKLAKFLRAKKEPVLYVPFSSKMLSMAVRCLVLSRFCPNGLSVIRSIQSPMGWLPKILMKLSGARMITLSRAAWAYYNDRLGRQVCHLKAGVDTSRFLPVDASQKMQLRRKYGLPADKLIVLHVGHLNSGRNVGKLLELDERFHGVLVVSTLTAHAREEELRRQLLEKENVTLIEEYLPAIQEMYQLADVYLFPVVERGRCIDSPLSAMEAASCDLPVVTTPFGELRELIGCEGFYEIGSLEPQQLNDLLYRATKEKKHTRACVMEYDWDASVEKLLSVAAPSQT